MDAESGEEEDGLR